MGAYGVAWEGIGDSHETKLYTSLGWKVKTMN